MAAAVIPKQERIERSAATAISEAFGGDEKTTLAVMRLMIWSARGLAIAEKFFPHRHASDDAIELLSNMLRVLCPSNDLTDLRDVIEDIDFTASD